MVRHVLSMPNAFMLKTDEDAREPADQIDPCALNLLDSETVFRDSPEAIVLTEPDGQIRHVNRAFQRITGYAPNDVIGRTTRGLYAEPESYDQALLIARSCTPTSQPRPFQTNLQRADNSTFPVRIVITQVLDDRAQIRGFAIIFTDLTTYESFATDLSLVIDQLTADCANLQMLYRETPALMFSVSYDGRVKQVSEAWLRRFGYAEAEVLGRPATDFMDDDSATRASEDFEHFWTAGSVDKLGYTLRTKSGDAVEVELSAVRQEIDGEPISLAILEDVTKRNRAWRMLKDRNAQLTSFAQVAAHDLQAPLRHISVFSNLLKNDMARGDLDAMHEKIEAIDISAQRLSAMIRGLLEFTVEAGDNLTLHRVQIEDLAQTSLANFLDQVTATQANILIEDLPVAKCDPVLIQRVFDNLIGNALKYVAPNVPPNITIASRQTGECWEISISDNGIGISPEFSELVFQPLKRLHGPDSDYSGCGIGLALCRKIVEAHKGRIWVEPGRNGGSRFVFTLPVDPQAR